MGGITFVVEALCSSVCYVYHWGLEEGEAVIYLLHSQGLKSNLIISFRYSE
jgi:hypothetical protein